MSTDTNRPFFILADKNGGSYGTGENLADAMRKNRVVAHPAGTLYSDDPGTFYRVTTDPALLSTEGRWPVRVFELHLNTQPILLPNSSVVPEYGVSKFTVVEEHPDHTVFGPNGVEVLALLERGLALSRYDKANLQGTEEPGSPESTRAVVRALELRRLHGLQKAYGNAVKIFSMRHTHDLRAKQPFFSALEATVVGQFILDEDREVLMRRWTEGVGAQTLASS